MTDVLEVSSLSEALVASKWCKNLVLGCAQGVLVLSAPTPHLACPCCSSRIAFCWSIGSFALYCQCHPLFIHSPIIFFSFSLLARGSVILLRRILSVVMDGFPSDLMSCCFNVYVLCFHVNLLCNQRPPQEQQTQTQIASSCRL